MCSTWNVNAGLGQPTVLAAVGGSVPYNWTNLRIHYVAARIPRFLRGGDHVIPRQVLVALCSFAVGQLSFIGLIGQGIETGLCFCVIADRDIFLRGVWSQTFCERFDDAIKESMTHVEIIPQGSGNTFKLTCFDKDHDKYE